ncbi:MAG: GldG family protein, partial [Armatimonadota bacterium]|nr:GldG family protein [Armatimonadota bacterium]
AARTAPEISVLARWAGALLVAAAFFAVAAVVAFGSFGRSNVWGWGFVVAGLLALGGWFVGRRQQEHLSPDQYARQRALLGVNAFTSVLLLLVLLVGVNYIAARRHKTFDLTSNKANSIAEQSSKILDQLSGPVKMTYAFAGREPDPKDVALLSAYKNASDKVRVEYVNAFKEPGKLRELNLNSFSGQPLLVLQLDESGKPDPKKPADFSKLTANRQEVTVIDEQNITSALYKLKDPKQRVLYFLSGHGEVSPTAFGSARSLGQAKTALEGQNYKFETLSLAGPKSQVPTAAAAVIALSPQVDLAPNEEKTLKDYIAGKGRLMLLLDVTRAPLPRWNSIVKALGIEVAGGLVEDDRQAYQNPQLPVGVVGESTRHELLRGVDAGTFVVFPGAIALRKAASAPPGLTVTPIFETSAESRSRPVSAGQKSQDGPFVLAAVVEAAAPPAMPGMPPPPPANGVRAVVVGNGLFASDQFYPLFGNGSFFLAAVNWTVGSDVLVSIPPKPPVTNRVDLMPPQVRFVTLFSLFALPLTVLILGGIVWWRRR